MNELDKAIERFRKNPEHDRLFLESQAEIDLCDRMVTMRLESGLTQSELAKRLGKSQAYVAKMESGGYDRCGIGTMRTFARAMGCDLAVSTMFASIEAVPMRHSDALLATRDARSSDTFSKVTILAEYSKIDRVAAAG